MASQAFEQLAALGGEYGVYRPQVGRSRQVLALIDPIRRTDSLGNQQFLGKTYELWIVRSASEGVEQVAPGYDTFSVKLQPTDDSATVLRITKVYPERDFGMPGDGTGMWHLEAVA